MSPRAGYRIVTPEDREAHPLVPEGALLYWCDYGEYRPSANVGLPWSAISNYLIPLGLWPEGDPAQEPKSGIVKAAKSMDRGQVFGYRGEPCFRLCENGYFCGREKSWDGHRHPLGHAFVSLADMVFGATLADPRPAAVSVPCDLAEEIHDYLQDLGDEMGMHIPADVAEYGEREMRNRLFEACARLRACPGYGSDAARTVRKDAT